MPAFTKHIPTMMESSRSGEFTKTLLESDDFSEKDNDSLKFFKIIEE